MRNEQMRNYIMKYLIIIFLLPLKLYSQDITGLWTGTIYNDTTKQTIHYEVAISETKGRYSGYSYTAFQVDDKEAVGVKSFKITRHEDHFFFADDDLLYNTYPSPPPKGVRQISSVTLSETGSIRVLSGKFITTRTRQYGRQVTGTLRLEQKKELKDDKLIASLKDLGLDQKLSFMPRDGSIAATIKKPEVKKPEDKPVAVITKKPKVKKPQVENKPVAVIVKPVNPIEELAKRKVATIETVFFTSDSLTLILYDNGYVDGDSVSLIVNGKVVLQHQRLSEQAITKTIPANIDSLKIIMYAENLGSIAPNTGLLIINDGEQRHEIRFEGDLENNAAIVLKRKRR